MPAPAQVPVPVRALDAPRDLRARFTWIVLAAVGWSGLGVLAAQLAAAVPPRAGFDLELLLLAGRRVAAGLSPYDPALLRALSAEDLFYSYPPPLAQALALVAAVPMPVALVALAAGAAAGLAFVARLLGERLAADRAVADTVLPVVALAPLVFPFAIAVLFGNLDATFPFVYGLLLAAALGASGGRLLVPAGVALAAAAIAKLHPASLWLWFVARPGDGRADLRVVAAAALVAGVVVAGVSLAVGGLGPWSEYLDVVRAGAAADLLDRRNVGPAAQLALLLGQPNDVARLLQVGVSVAALVVTVVAARSRPDPVESLAWAATASLVTLPVTWFHYPVALIPFGIAAALRAADGPRRRAVLGALIAAGAAGALAIALPVAVWLAVAALLAAVRFSIPPATAPRASSP